MIWKLLSAGQTPVSRDAGMILLSVAKPLRSTRSDPLESGQLRDLNGSRRIIDLVVWSELVLSAI
ncbi:MAG: hypothetical protein WKF81_04225 [Thermomicrobiales bacterium]